MSSPPDLKYNREHQWVRADSNTATIGITEFAQQQLGDIVFVELPRLGATVKAGARFGTVESSKTASDVYAPVSGEVVAVNGSLEDTPEIINSSPYGQGWLVQVRMADANELERLLSAAEYDALLVE